MEYKVIKGMSDILPSEIYKWQYVEERAKDFFSSRFYEEIRTPVLEYASLFIRSIGESTDIVSKEIYSFTDRGGRELALRPEATASVVRAVAEANLLAKRDIWKLFYFGPMFRAERPQAGRKRQFYQLGVEVIGPVSAEADAVTVKDLALFLSRLGFAEGDIELQVNSIGKDCCRGGYKEKLRKYFSESFGSLCESCKVKYEKNILRIFDCKNEVCRKISSGAPKITDNLCADCAAYFERFCEFLDKFGIKYSVNKEIVRGLDYYTGVVFEVATGLLGAQDAIAAGGRYDSLMSEISGGKVNAGAVGFAMGMERVILALERAGVDILPINNRLKKSVYIAYADKSFAENIPEISNFLESEGIPSYWEVEFKSLKSQMKRCNKFGFKWALILNSGDYEEGKVSLKDMENSSQTDFEVKDLSIKVSEIINGKGI